MSETIDHGRRELRSGTAQVQRVKPSPLPAAGPRSHVPFGLLKQIDAGNSDRARLHEQPARAGVPRARGGVRAERARHGAVGPT